MDEMYSLLLSGPGSAGKSCYFQLELALKQVILMSGEIPEFITNNSETDPALKEMFKNIMIWKDYPQISKVLNKEP
jgi:hypothetical protein